MTTDAWITLAVLVVTFGVLAFDRLPAAHDRSGVGRLSVVPCAMSAVLPNTPLIVLGT